MAMAMAGSGGFVVVRMRSCWKRTRGKVGVGSSEGEMGGLVWAVGWAGLAWQKIVSCRASGASMGKQRR